MIGMEYISIDMVKGPTKSVCSIVLAICLVNFLVFLLMTCPFHVGQNMIPLVWAFSIKISALIQTEKFTFGSSPDLYIKLAENIKIFIKKHFWDHVLTEKYIFD